MSKIKIISVGASDAPSIPTSQAYFDVMHEIEAFQNEHTDDLCHEYYESLSENATVMRTLGNVVCSGGKNDYFVSRLRDANLELAFYRQLVKRLK